MIVTHLEQLNNYYLTFETMIVTHLEQQNNYLTFETVDVTRTADGPNCSQLPIYHESTRWDSFKFG